MFRSGDRQSPERLKERFADVPPPLTLDEARVEAARCLYCFDAPCTRACPTHIDVPRFIRQILHHDELSAARTILDANVFGGSCARACPTEVLCEGACVDSMLMKSPVQIGRLQRHACDTAGAAGFERIKAGESTGKRVAIVGSGPAGLACASTLRQMGHGVTVYEARSVPGGLDTLGIAAYKISTEFALSEIEMIRRIGIDIEFNHRVTAGELRALLEKYDAVFLGIGLGRTMPLAIEGEELEGVWESLDFIFQTHTKPLEDCTVGANVVVIGAGNTAIDVATVSRRLGAETVTIAYRRSDALVPAFAYEYELAKSDGVRFEWCVQPLRIVGEAGRATGVVFQRTELPEPATRSSPVRAVPGSEFLLPADMVVKALGQEHLLDLVAAVPGLQTKKGAIVVDRATLMTSIPGLFAGGDCLRSGGEVVDAVQDGKIAARGIDTRLRTR
jgi:dihydropyrimidine dehydrogenase (NAD+) subunit PreT